MVRFEAVTKRFAGGIEALSGVSFEVSPGEMAVIAGRSGAGKSTLLRLVPAIERPSSGRVLVGGQDVGNLKPAAVPFLRRSLGLVFQDQKLLSDRSVYDNVMLPLAITGYPPKDAQRRVRAALDKVGLLERERAMPAALSGGEQQRLTIARAIVNRPALLIADEPTANLDSEYAHEIAELLNSFKQVGVTVMVATHDESLFAGFASRCIRLDRGRLAS